MRRQGAFPVSMRRTAEQLLDHVPADGCLLVFNAPHLTFRQAVCRVARGVFDISVCERFPNGTGELQQNCPRNLYITWRE